MKNTAFTDGHAGFADVVVGCSEVLIGQVGVTTSQVLEGADKARSGDFRILSLSQQIVATRRFCCGREQGETECSDEQHGIPGMIESYIEATGRWGFDSQSKFWLLLLPG